MPRPLLSLDVDGVLNPLGAEPDVALVDLRNVSYGCYNFVVQQAEPHHPAPGRVRMAEAARFGHHRAGQASQLPCGGSALPARA